MSKTLPLMQEWKGMAPDTPRDRMPTDQVWLMQDYIPRLLGSSLESRQGWRYYVPAPIYPGAYVTAQIWVNTLGGNHHLAATTDHIYNLDNPASPRDVLYAPGCLWPMTTLFEYVLIPRITAQPVFLRYAGGVEVHIPAHSSTPAGKVAATWNGRFVLANTAANPNRLHFLASEWPSGLTESVAWDLNAWVDTSADITALAPTRTSLLIFHEGTVERLRGTRPPGTDIDPDVWLEPLIGLGGCNEPHTVCFWNDNVVFADARGVYMTDGTQIKDISDKSIGRTWRQAYDPLWRLSAGVVYNQYVVAMVDVTNHLFKKCFVCDLATRNWSVLTNIPCSSFVATTGEVEKLFGGGVDGRVIDLTEMWREADPISDTVDGNGIPVLPQLETAWYRMSQNTAMKRLKNIYFLYDLDEVNGQVRVYGCKQVQPRSPADWVPLGTLQEGDILDNRGQSVEIDGYQRRRIPVGQEAYGFTFKIETTGTIQNLKFHDLAAELLPGREESYTG